MTRIDLLRCWRDRIPDAPATLETRALALAANTLALAIHPDGVLLVDNEQRLGGLFGDCSATDVARVYGEHQLDCELVAPASLAPEPWKSWGFEPELATLLQLGEAGFQQPQPLAEVVVRPLEHNDLNSPAIRRHDWYQEHLLAAAQGTVWGAFCAGTPRALAYVPWRTERFADLSVATLEPNRRRGLGGQVVAAAIASILDAGIEPIWGAVASNVASRGLAQKLGFTATAGELLVLSPPESEGGHKR